jgi:hypothetical protein
MNPVRFFTDMHALDSLRNSDFDSISAYGEVVDNSIQANSKNIRIHFETFTQNTTYEHIKFIAFGDDGDGMDSNTLHHCSQIGWSSRYNQRNGIGRFGVGMTLAAIHECKRVEIYSKKAEGEWLWTYMDLDEICKESQDTIPIPMPRKVPVELQYLAGKTKGTIVVWSKYDRQSANAKRIIEDANIWLGRTYRYFIWDDGINLFLNGEDIKAIDPLYHRTEKTRFPDDPKAEKFHDITFTWNVDEFDAPEGTPQTSEVRICTSILPEEWRKKQGSGGSAHAKNRFIPDNEGISILRNRREVFYGHIPYWGSASSKTKGWPRFEEKDRFWGCEIHFNAVLDRAFTVKNIKRGADPSKELKTTIKEQITPTRQTCMERIDEVWKATKQNEREAAQQSDDGDPLGRPDSHLEAERIAKITPTDTSAIDSDINSKEATEDFFERKAKNVDAEKRARMEALFQSQPFTILEETWPGPQLVDASFLGGKAVLQYNMSHIFFEEVYGIIEGLDQEGTDKYISTKKLKTLLDILIISHAKAESRFPPDADMSSQDFIDNLRVNWGQYLQSYVRTWLKENTDE